MEDQTTLKRNVDVLIQLLQCGEHTSLSHRLEAFRHWETDNPEEIIHIRQGLVQHLSIDPNVTMSVLCDQLTWTEDELGNREQLRTRVLEFLTRNPGPLNAAIARSSDQVLVQAIIDVSFLPYAPTFAFTL